MAKQQGTYTKQEQEAIKAEVDDAVQKLLHSYMRKYHGVVIGSSLSFTFPSTPAVISHSGNTRPLSAKEVTPPLQATE